MVGNIWDCPHNNWWDYCECRSQNDKKIIAKFRVKICFNYQIGSLVICLDMNKPACTSKIYAVNLI